MAQGTIQVRWKGTDGDDTHVGGALRSELEGGDGNDTITGGVSADTLWGGNGNDTVDGGDGDDCVYGGQGDDTIIGGRGNDNLFGGSGVNTYRFSVGDGGWDQVADFKTGDIIEFVGLEGGRSAVEIVQGLDGSDGLPSTRIQYGDGDMIILWGLAPADLDWDFLRFVDGNDDDSGGDVFVPAPEEAQGESALARSAPETTGTEGDDTYVGTDDDEMFDGGRGSDTIRGGMGDDVIRGGKGDDMLYGGTGNAGADYEYYSMTPGVSDDDTMYGGRGHDLLDGGKGDDTLYGGKGGDTLYGDDGNDTLNGGRGIDHLEGGQGNDRLIGGRGNDCLYGGKGDDTFVFTVGDGTYDHIDQLEDGDRIEFRGLDGGFEALDIRERDDGLGTEIRYGDGGDMIVLWGVASAELTESDFVFEG